MCFGQWIAHDIILLILFPFFFFFFINLVHECEIPSSIFCLAWKLRSYCISVEFFQEFGEQWSFSCVHLILILEILMIIFALLFSIV